MLFSLPKLRSRIVFLSLCAALLDPSLVSAQTPASDSQNSAQPTPPDLAEGWIQSPTNPGTVRHLRTRLVCPISLLGNYRLFKTDIYPPVQDVSCTYATPDDDGLLSFYFYPTRGQNDTPAFELENSSRVILSMKAPGATPESSNVAVSLPGGTQTVQAKRMQAQTQEGKVEAFTLLDQAGWRFKVRETYTPSKADQSRQAANALLAAQAEALTNARACETKPEFPRNKAALFDNLKTATGIAVTSSAIDFTTLTNTEGCVTGYITLPEGGYALVRYGIGTNSSIGVYSDDSGKLRMGIVNFHVSPELKNILPDAALLEVKADNEMIVYRGYKKWLSLNQSVDDLNEVISGRLKPIASLKRGTDGENSTVTFLK